MTTYEVRNELADGTLEAGFITFTSKSKAVSAARRFAKEASWQVVRRIVWNADEDMQVAEFDAVRG